MGEKIYFNAEGFNLKTEKLEDGSDGIILEGIAMPIGKISRNKVFYRPESVKKAYKTMKGAAFLFNHNTDISLGHVEDVGLDEKAAVMTYRANMDPDEEKYVKKVKRQDIRHVSVGALVDGYEFMEDGSVKCDIVEFVELSLVPVPGFADASANVKGEVLEVTPMMLAEKFGDEAAIEKLKSMSEKKEDDKDKKKDEDADPEKKEELSNESNEDEKCGKKKKKETDDEDDSNDSDDSNEAEDDDEDKGGEESAKAKSEEDLKKEAGEEAGEGEEESVEEKLSVIGSRVEELFAMVDEMNNRMSIVEANMDAMNKDEEGAKGEGDNEDDDKDEADDEDDKDKKSDESLIPDKDEKFVDEKTPQKNFNKKENLEAKEKALFGKESKKVNEGKRVVNMGSVRRNNISF